VHKTDGQKRGDGDSFQQHERQSSMAQPCLPDRCESRLCSG
jgi:hypothetical protein